LGSPASPWRRLAHRAAASARAASGHGRRGVALALLVVVLGAVLVGGLLRVRVDTSINAFLPASDPSMVGLEEKSTEFGGDPIIVLLRSPQPRQLISDTDQLHRLLGLEGALAKLPDVATVYGPATVLNQLAGAAQDFLASIGQQRDAVRQAAEQAALSRGAAPDAVAAAGQAAVDQVNQRYAPLIVQGLPVGLPTLNNARFGPAVIYGPDGLAKPKWRFIVPASDTVAVLVRPRQDMDQDSTRRLLDAIRTQVAGAGLDTSTVTISGAPTIVEQLGEEVAHEAPLIGLLVLLVLVLRFVLFPGPGGRWRRLLPLGYALLGGATLLSITGWLGYPLSMEAVVLLPLLLGVGSSFPLYLTVVPDRRTVLVMSAASAAAFLALTLSPLPFVRDLGLTLAGGVVITVAVTLLLHRRRGRPGEPEPAGPSWTATPAAWLPARWRARTRVDPARPPRRGRGAAPRGAVAVLVIAAATLGWVVLPRIGVSANPIDLARGLPALADAQTVEATLGASGELTVRLTGPDVLSPAALSWAAGADSALAHRFGERLPPVVSVSSLFDFLGAHPTEGQIRDAAHRVPDYLTSSVVRPDRQEALLVYGIKLQDLAAQQRLLRDVTATLPPPPPGYHADLVGLPVAAARGYQLLSGDRYLANLAGIVLAGLVLGAGLRTRWDTLRAVAAGLLATGWGLGLMWVLGIPFSPLTLALGSLISVTGCEFVVLLAAARRHSHRWLRASLVLACATSALGYLAVVPSRLWLIREFGLVLAAAVILSYLAARLVIWLAPPPAPRAPHWQEDPPEPLMKVNA
jgi:uncharacterized protein